MTIGKDVSGLFADVVKNMQTEDLELKKLVYLYLMNYAKSQPELVILAINTFVKVRIIFLLGARGLFVLTIHIKSIICRTLTIQIPLSEHSQSEPWAVSA